MTTDDARRRSLGELVRRCRVLNGLSIDEAASRAPMGPTTWTRVEQGLTVRDLTLPGVDRVLGWPEGASADFLSGGPEPQAATTDGHAEGAGATVTTLEARPSPVAEAAGLPLTPPFPKPKNKSQAAVNRYWQALKEIAESEGDEVPPEEGIVRTLRRANLELEGLQERAEGAS